MDDYEKGEKNVILPYAIVLSPTRELSQQTKEQFEALGKSIGLRVISLLGGMDMVSQSIGLAKRPHIIVGSPGRVLDHLLNTKGFNLKNIKHFVLDEADKLLSMDFEKEIIQIIENISDDRRNYLFSATMTSSVEKLKRVSLRNPVKIQLSNKFKPVKTLLQ